MSDRPSRVRKIRDWALDRFGLGVAREVTLDRRVARSPWYFGDGATLTLLLGVLIVTGATMTLTYAPTPDAAYESVRHITERQRAGWFLRAVHYWAAGLMVVMLFIHLFRQILLGGYKFPREGTWLIGVGLFALVLVMSFTGYVLRWDERAIYALKVALHMFQNVPLIGERLVIFVQGGIEPGQSTLTRIYSVHVIFVPLLILLLVAWHLYLVMLHGVTSYGERRQPVRSAAEQKALYKAQAESQEGGETFHPYTTAKSGAMALLVFALVVALALVLGPAALQPRANLTEPAFPAEEWWFWWVSGLIALLPPRLAPIFVVVFPVVVLLALILLPLIDRGPRRGMRKRPLAVLFVVATVIALLYLTDLRYRSQWTAWPTPDPPPVPEGVIIGPTAEQGRQLFAQYGCNTCHPIAGHGWTFGPDLARPPGLRSRAEMGEFILRPPEGVVMPAYEGRITDEQLELLLDFVHAAQAFPRE